MIVLSAKARTGKTTFCQLNSFAALYDLIVCQSLFGSLDFEGSHHDNEPSFVANGLIPLNYFGKQTTLLNNLELKPNICTYAVVNYSGFDYDTVDEQKLFVKYDPVDLKIPNMKYKGNITEIDRYDYLKIGSCEPFYVKIGERYYPLLQNVLYPKAFISEGSDILYLMRFVPIIDNKGAFKIVCCNVCGIGFLVDKVKLRVGFALAHSLFIHGVDFLGLPYMNIAEAGPSAPNYYIYPRRLSREERDNDIICEDTKTRAGFFFKQKDVDILANITNLAEHVGALFVGMNFLRNIGEIRANLIPTAVAGGLALQSIIGFPAAIAFMTALPEAAVPIFIVTLLAQAIPVVLDIVDLLTINRDEIAICNFTDDPTGLLLKTNRCFIDSIIDLIYTSGGSTLTGGIPTDVIKRFINNQMNESFGVYSMLGESGEKDPFRNLATDAHMTGEYSFVAKGEYPNELYFTTRRTNNRSQWYAVVDKEYIYGNHIIAKRDNRVDLREKLKKKVNYNTFHSFDDNVLYKAVDFSFGSSSHGSRTLRLF